jgi:hypothetical protein
MSTDTKARETAHEVREVLAMLGALPFIGEDGLAHRSREVICALTSQNAELLALVEEVLRAGNANTRATKELMRQAGTSWSTRSRAAIALARGAK